MPGSSVEQVFKYINSNEPEKVRAILSADRSISVDSSDENGMTMLQASAFKGSMELCRLLLDLGADVNSNKHQFGYTALMFAALSGKPDVCRLLLSRGAKTYTQNTVNKTASQLAAFTGQHECATVINNFIDRECVDHFTVKSDLEKEPRLPPAAADDFHHFILQANMHPVGLLTVLRSHPALLALCKGGRLRSILELMAERFIKSRDTNDVLSIKSHYIGELVRQAEQILGVTEGSAAGVDKAFQKWTKSLLSGREEDGFPEGLELWIRGALKSYPYIDSQLFQQMIRLIAPTKLGEGQTALDVLHQALNGLSYGRETQSCDTCGELGAGMKCAACSMVSYCNRPCQKLHWFTHKKFCSRLAEKFAERVKEKAAATITEKADAELDDVAFEKIDTLNLSDSTIKENPEVPLEIGAGDNAGDVSGLRHRNIARTGAISD